MHIADILSRLAGKDLEPSDQLIPISFNVLTRSKSKLTQPLKMYTPDKHKQSHLPLQKNLQKQHPKTQVQSKIIYPQKKLVPSQIQTSLPKQMTVSTLPPVPHGILR